MPAINDVYQVSVYCTIADQVAVNVQHWIAGANTGAGCSDAQIASGFDVLYAPLYASVITAAAQYYGVKVQKIFPLPVSIPVFSKLNTQPGILGPNCVSKQTSGIITLRTALAGRKFRGRMYVPFPSSSNVTVNGQPNAGYMTALTNLAASQVVVQNFGGGGNTTPFTRAIYHRATHTFDRVLLVEPRPLFATQRRRGDYGRPNALPF
jgi:hypothetical protein